MGRKSTTLATEDKTRLIIKLYQPFLVSQGPKLPFCDLELAEFRGEASEQSWAKRILRPNSYAALRRRLKVIGRFPSRNTSISIQGLEAGARMP